MTIHNFFESGESKYFINNLEQNKLPKQENRALNFVLNRLHASWAAKEFGMKNRKPSSHDNLVSPKSILTETSKSQIDIRNRKKSSSSSFFKKTAEVLQTYKGIFTKPTTYTIGHADTLFRQSLRNYDDFEIRNTVKWGSKKDKSFESLKSVNLKRRTSQSPFTYIQGDNKYKQRVRSARKETRECEKPTLEVVESKEETFRVQVVEEEVADDTELEVFYSPNSQVEEPESSNDSEDFGTEVISKDFYITAVQPKAALDPTFETEKLKSLTEVLEVDSEREFIMADDELQEVEDLVQQAGSELNEVVADAMEFTDVAEESTAFVESEDMVETTAESAGLETETAITAESEAEGPTTTEADSNMETEKLMSVTDTEGTSKITESGKTPIGYDPNIDAAVIKELEDAERQAMETAKIIYDLKQRVAQLLSKSKMTEVEGRELEEKNRQLRQQMSLFETKTKRIQFLVDQASLFENMSPRPPKAEKKHTEDLLPKVIICGMTENNMPKIIVCDDKKKKPSPISKTGCTLPPPSCVMPQFAKRLSESYYMQERLAAENAALEGKRYKLQEDLLDKDQTVESLQRKLNSLQGEMRMVCKENSLLSDKLQRIESCPESCSKGDYSEISEAPVCKKHPKKKMPCGKNKGPCPADVEARLQEYSDTTHQLEKQLSEMETEVRNMQTELIAVQKERQHLEQHRRMLASAPPPCPPPPCAPAPCAPPPCAKPPCQGPCNPSARMGGSAEQQLRELREQYNRLQDDFKGKLTEVAGLRADNEKSKQIAKDSEETRKIAEEKLKELEKEMKNYKSDKNKFLGSKEQLVEQEQQLNVAKQRFREAQDELEELRALIQDQQAQLDDYRNKYLQAQQQVEEQRRQIDMMEMENNRISEQVNLEIQRVKNQFQEKLQELTPLPDILKATQLKLQEAQQLHLLAERNNEALVHELQAYRDKAAAMADQMERVRSDQQLGADEKATLEQRAAEVERKLAETQEENDRLKTELARMEEIAEQNEKRVQEKLHEIAQLVSQLETVREESARQVARTKDRCETVRRSMQNQIADLERQLAQSRAQARSAQKDRDDIRQKMQAQINNLNENFEDAQMRIRNLQGHVNFLKNSYTSVFPPNDALVSDGMNPCDCGNTY